MTIPIWFYLLVYTYEIVALGYGISIIYYSRPVFRGMARSLIVLCLFLMLRRLDDVGLLFGVDLVNPPTTLLTSSMVVWIFVTDLHRLSKTLFAYEQKRRELRRREDELESLRTVSENNRGEWRK